MKLSLSEEQVLWFRARRGHLVGEGAPDAASAARAVVGIQAQQEGPALLGLSQRMASRPSAETLGKALREAPRQIVRTWGQRDTVHIFDPASEWAHVIYARALWGQPRRQGVMPSEEALDAGLELALRGPVTREDIYEIVPDDYVAAVSDHAQSIKMEPRRFAAGRVLWRLSHRGDLCYAEKIGAQQAYAARQDWFADLPWPEDLDPLVAASELARRYLASYGPATPADVAHFFQAKVTEAKRWLATFKDDLVEIDCGGRKGLVALVSDVDALQEAPPSGKGWPVRLLPTWDGLLMGHKDKDWIIPNQAERKKVWRPGAYVAATVLARGRLAGTWKNKVKRGILQVELTPLSAWKQAFLAEVKQESQAVARHFGLEAAEVSLV